MAREHLVRLSEDEVDGLETVAEQEIGTSDVAYGASVSLLLSHYQRTTN